MLVSDMAHNHSLFFSCVSFSSLLSLSLLHPPSFSLSSFSPACSLELVLSGNGSNNSIPTLYLFTGSADRRVRAYRGWGQIPPPIPVLQNSDEHSSPNNCIPGTIGEYFGTLRQSSDSKWRLPPISNHFTHINSGIAADVPLDATNYYNYDHHKGMFCSSHQACVLWCLYMWMRRVVH